MTADLTPAVSRALDAARTSADPAFEPLVDVAHQGPGIGPGIAGVGERQRRLDHDPKPGAMIRVALAPCSPLAVPKRVMEGSAALAERYARPGDVQLLYRHYSNSERPEQLGFFGAEAAAEQGYGWQYIYLFFRGQDEAERVGVDQVRHERRVDAEVAGGGAVDGRGEHQATSFTVARSASK